MICFGLSALILVVTSSCVISRRADVPCVCFGFCVSVFLLLCLRPACLLYFPLSDQHRGVTGIVGGLLVLREEMTEGLSCVCVVCV
jgi:hypothetical protein